jgi:glycosyltransferase involved in cell wall biosynthesis
MIRLLSVIHGPAFGGAHNQALRLSRPLAERGVETLVVLPAEGELAANRLRAAGVQTVTMRLRRLRATPSPAVQARFAASLTPDVRRLRALIRQRGIDVVQVHGATNPHGAFAARREGAAVVWQLFDTRAPLALRRLAMPIVVRLADGMTVWGKELVRLHPGSERLGQRITIVYPPVDGREFAPDPDTRAAVRAELGVADDTTMIGSVGVLNPQKGHEYLVRAAAIVARERDDVEFAIVGHSSPAHAAYERRLRDEVRELGLASRFRFIDPGTRVPALVQALDVFALTSVPRSEGMPTVILEAMHAGKPVVATDVAAVRDLVEDGETGLVVAPERPGEIARALTKLVDDAELGHRLGAAGMAQARGRFDLDGLAALHAAAYHAAVERRTRTAS